MVDEDPYNFIDNEDACSSHSRGESRQADVMHMVQSTHLLRMLLRARSCVEWVDSLCIPSDGMSRAGEGDGCSRIQGLDTSDAYLPVELVLGSAFEGLWYCMLANQ